MSFSKVEHYFYPGRKGKTGRVGPGILVVEGRFKFRVNQVNKANTIFTMYCVQQGNTEFSCKAKAKVVRTEDGTFFLHSCDKHHNHLVNSALIVAEELKQRMAKIVCKDPAKMMSQ